MCHSKAQWFYTVCPKNKDVMEKWALQSTLALVEIW